MTERIFIGVAWPYANGSLHLGHVAGAYLPADIFARYHRLKGNEVLMVSGSDQHGTPITLKAEQEGKNPREIIDFYQKEFQDCWQKLGITFDLFTGTHTDNHAATAQDIFLKLHEKGYLYLETVSQMYCPKCQRFLADRYVEGSCPFCKAAGARGDQCDGCGKTLNPTELVKPYCRICKTTPALKESEHFFLKLSAFQDKLEKWVDDEKNQWRPNVYGLTQRYLKEGLKDRAITRDIEWGIPVPLKGYENKRLYVWFEAVIGYLSASKEWASKTGHPEKWRDYWDEQKPGKSYYFIGKDNIPFHTIIWPAMLMGYAGLKLPYDVPSNEFLTFENLKGSKSRNWAVWVPDYLTRYDPDPLRYMLSINMPESNDTDFSWRVFVQRNNDELVATYGNLVNRVLTFTYKNFEGKVPEPGALDESDKNLIDNADACLDKVGEAISRCSFKQAIGAAMALAQESNRYLDGKAPWKKIKEDKQAAATSLYVAINAISRLKTMLAPFLPFSSQKVHEYLGFSGKVEDYGWQPQAVKPGQTLCQPQPLFKKLDDSIIEEETKRLGT
jgi:methionyl-tRNA synthetase